MLCPRAVSGGSCEGKTHLHDQLMGSRYQCQAVAVVEGLRDVLPKGVARTTRRDAPASPVIRVRPQKITHRTLRIKGNHDLIQPFITKRKNNTVDNRSANGIQKYFNSIDFSDMLTFISQFTSFHSTVSLCK